MTRPLSATHLLLLLPHCCRYHPALCAVALVPCASCWSPPPWCRANHPRYPDVLVVDAFMLLPASANSNLLLSGGEGYSFLAAPAIAHRYFSTRLPVIPYDTLVVQCILSVMCVRSHLHAAVSALHGLAVSHRLLQVQVDKAGLGSYRIEYTIFTNTPQFNFFNPVHVFAPTYPSHTWSEPCPGSHVLLVAVSP
jgi:hypothetical protein